MKILAKRALSLIMIIMMIASVLCSGITTSAAEIVDSNVVLSGSFNDWSATSYAMTQNTEGIYTYSIYLEYGTYYFNIVCDGLWYGTTEIYNDNVTDEVLTMSGGACTLAATGGTYEFTFDTNAKILNITQTYCNTDLAEISKVYLAGEFNNWDSVSNVMTRESQNVVSTTVTLFSGFYYFKVVCDGLWYGREISILNSTSSVQMYSDEGNCRLQATGGNYTFHFNISTKTLSVTCVESNLAPTDVAKVSLAGSFNDWSTTENIMVKSSSYYVSTSVDLKAGTYYFKIVQDGLWYGSNNVLPNTANNFQLSSTEGNCCIQTLGGTYTFMYDVVNHKLTMLYSPKETDPAETAVVSLAGTFNDWSKTANYLTCSEENVVSTTLDLSQGTYYFKIVKDELWYGNNGIISDTTTSTSASGWKLEITNGDCTLEASGGKYTFKYNVITNNLIVLFVGTPVDPADTAKVSLSGSFNEWSTTANILEKKSANVVSTTIVLPRGTHYFKMVRNGLWYGNNGVIEDRTTKTSIDGWEMSSIAPECVLEATGGTYTFDYDVTQNRLTVDCELSDPALTADVVLSGDFNDWSTSDNVFTYSEKNVVTASVFLFPGTYKFKIVDSGLWYGNSGTIINTTNSTSISGWEMSPTATECILETSGGTYTFNYNVVTKHLILLCKLDDYDPAKYSDVRLVADFNNWDKEASKMTYVGDRAVLIDVELEEGTYEFKIVEDGLWYGNNGTIENNTVDTSSIGWVLTMEEGNCKLKATGGKYTFIYRVVPNTIIIFHNYDHNYL